LKPAPIGIVTASLIRYSETLRTCIDLHCAARQRRRSGALH
jgi:hypothetical protein